MLFAASSALFSGYLNAPVASRVGESRVAVKCAQQRAPTMPFAQAPTALAPSASLQTLAVGD